MINFVASEKAQKSAIKIVCECVPRFYCNKVLKSLLRMNLIKVEFHSKSKRVTSLL